MKLRSIALAGVALAALTAPAAASDYMGWYLGAGIGYGYPMLMHVDTPLGPGHIPYDPDALGLVSAGYKWDSNIRTELELGYKGHSTDPDIVGGQQRGGGVTIKSVLFNVNYDVPLWHGLTWTIGAGIGGGAMVQDTKIGTTRLIYGQKVGFMWQGMSGISIGLSPAVDFFADWRYRSSEIDSDFHSDVPGLSPVHVKNLRENDAVIGIRWYLEPPVAVVTPPPPPPPPPPAQVVCPVKTYIVFFDFDKSNLTEKAQEVVAEAVKSVKSPAASQCNIVKVLVTGHTDTVGSDTYNQALSERRAQSVKDEMVREGVDASAISTVGKSFHDPLVPTGPGVREPQNRRAVIDLGG